MLSPGVGEDEAFTTYVDAVEGTGPDHDKSFTADVHVGELVFDGGSGRSKKEAEQMVAEIAWRSINASLESAVTANP